MTRSNRMKFRLEKGIIYLCRQKVISYIFAKKINLIKNDEILTV